MTKVINKAVFDIKNAIDEIYLFISERSLSFEAYTKDILLKRAVERNLEIIGEAMNRILKVDPNFPIQEAKQIISLRNLIIHSYDNISDEMIYSIIVNHLPKLKREIEDLLPYSI